MNAANDHPPDGAPAFVADTSIWVQRCVARLIELDPVLIVSEAQQLADEISQRQRWRAMLPEAAAERMFDPYTKSAPNPP